MTLATIKEYYQPPLSKRCHGKPNAGTCPVRGHKQCTRRFAVWVFMQFGEDKDLNEKDKEAI